MAGPNRESTEDVAEFCHALLWPVVLWREHGVGALFRPSELFLWVPDLARASHHARICAESGDRCRQPLLTTPRMGDQKSMRASQAYGQHLFREAHVMTDAARISYGLPAPLRRLWEGSHVD